MALPASGPISFADLNSEIRRGSTATTSLGEAAVRTTADRVAGNQSISFSDLLGRTYGASTVFVASTSLPRAHAYRWSQGFGTKYSNPASTPNGTPYHVTANIKKTVVGFNQNSVTNRYLSFYPWSDASGFGTRYAATTTHPVASAVSTNGGATFAFSPDGNAVVVGSIAGTPPAVAWAWSDASGFGTKFSDPSTAPPTDLHALHFFGGPLGYGNAPDEVIIFGATSTDANRLSAWNFNSSTGWGAKMANPATMPSLGVFTITSDVFDVITGTQSTNSTERRSAAYEFDPSTGFGTKYSAMAATEILGNPSGTQLSWIRTGSFTQAVSYVWGRTTAGLAGTGIATFPWTSGWGTKYSDPGTPIPSADGAGEEVSFNLNLDLGVAHEGSPYVTIYPWSNGYGTKYADPATLPGSNCYSIHMATSFNVY
jgi:hypothetical protein